VELDLALEVDAETAYQVSAASTVNQERDRASAVRVRVEVAAVSDFATLVHLNAV